MSSQGTSITGVFNSLNVEGTASMVQTKITSAEECAAILKKTIADYAAVLQGKGSVTQADAETLIKAATVSIANGSAYPEHVPTQEIADTIVHAIKDLDSGMVENVIENAGKAIFSIISREPTTPKKDDAPVHVTATEAPPVPAPEPTVAAEPAPVKKEPMPREVWQDLYAMRNGQLVVIYSLKTDADIKKIRQESTLGHYDNRDQSLTKEGKYILGGNWAGPISSWGEFVAFAVMRKLDLQGLTLSPQQKQYAYELELQKKNLAGAKLNSANLDCFDLTGTDLSKAQLNMTSLRETRGSDTKFNEAQAGQIDLTGAYYIRPDFSGMSAPRSNHFRSHYDQPKLDASSWTSSRLIGTTMMLNTVDKPFNISGSLLAGCLLYGIGTDIVQPKLAYNKASFPGTAFYNVGIIAGEPRGINADFSPLLKDDPRLLPDELDHVFSTTWINGKHGLDGLKVSPHVRIKEDENEKCVVFSEVKFDTGDKAKPENNVLFFAKGSVIERSGFHDVRVAELDSILPEPVLKLMRKIETPVISAAAPEPVATQEPEKKASYAPQLNVDKDSIALQIEALKKSSMAEAMALGNSVQVSFSEASTVVTNWAMAKLAQKSEFAEKIGGLITALETYSIFPVLDVQPEPEPEQEEPLPPKPPARGYFMRGFFGPSDEEVAYAAAVARRQEKELERQRAEEAKRLAPKPKDIFETTISKDLAALSTVATAALKDNMTGIEDVESLHNYLGTLKDVIKTYVGGIEAVVPSLITENPSVIKIAEMCKHNMSESYASLDRLDNGIRTYMDAVVDNGIAVHNVQGKILDLNIHFNKASGLHSLNKVLETSPEGYSKDQKLAGLYSMVVTAPLAEKPARTQVQEAFMQAKANIVASLKEAFEVMEKAGEQRKAALGAILNPVQPA